MQRRRPRRPTQRRLSISARQVGSDGDGFTEDDPRPRPRSTYRAQFTLTGLRALGAARRGQWGYIVMDYELVEMLAANGLNSAEIAEGLAVSKNTVQSRLNGRSYENEIPDPEFVAAFNRGRAQMRHLISNGIFTKAIKGDSAALFFLAKTRLGWRENAEEKAVMNPADVAAVLRDELTKASA